MLYDPVVVVFCGSLAGPDAYGSANKPVIREVSQPTQIRSSLLHAPGDVGAQWDGLGLGYPGLVSLDSQVATGVNGTGVNPSVISGEDAWKPSNGYSAIQLVLFFISLSMFEHFNFSGRCWKVSFSWKSWNLEGFS